MPRNRQSAKKAGTSFESSCATFLTRSLGKKITRMPKSGAFDKGDLYGLEYHGNPMVGECKSPGEESSWRIAQWWRETEEEMNNYASTYGVLIVKRYRKPVSDSICVVDDDMWASIHGHDYATPVHYPAIPHGRWGDIIDSHTVCAVDRRGKNITNQWIIFPLSMLVTILLGQRYVDSIYITDSQAQELMDAKKLTAMTEDGVEVVITIGTPPEIDLASLIADTPVSFTPCDFNDSEPLIEF